ncbi:MAG: electron transfer flavoprotein subunit alpha/FixB family protein [Chitinophagales bacterium]
MVIFYIEHENGSLKKNCYETAAYAAALAQQTQSQSVGICLGSVSAESLAALGEYGTNKVLQDTNARFDTEVDAGVLAKAVAAQAQQLNAQYVIIPHSYLGRALAPRVSVRLKAALVPAVVEMPDTEGKFLVKRGVFSGKGFAYCTAHTTVKVLTVAANAFPAIKTGTSVAEVQNFTAETTDTRVKRISVEKLSNKVSLTEADIVVSAGRGLKGPENWGMIEELADVLGAATACSRPVADTHWRPHHEHVGQTGVTVSPNLYIAIGISGAIQHLAGVNSSKVIVVINKDPEAPFFKAADYGVVGDAFEVVPKLITALKAYKAS